MSRRANAIERVRQFARSAVGDDDPYHCLNCEAGFDVQYHVCPDCGGFSVEPTAVGE